MFTIVGIRTIIIIIAYHRGESKLIKTSRLDGILAVPPEIALEHPLEEVLDRPGPEAQVEADWSARGEALGSCGGEGQTRRRGLGVAKLEDVLWGTVALVVVRVKELLQGTRL